MTLTERISKLMEILSGGLTERENLVRLGFLSIISEQPIYLYGRAGSGKKIIIDHLIKAFKSPKIQMFGRRNHDIIKEAEPSSIIIFNSFEGSNTSMVNSIQIVMEERLTRALILSGHQRPEVALSSAGLADSIHLVLSIPETLSPEALQTILQENGDPLAIEIPEDLSISNEEWDTWIKEIRDVKISEDSFSIITSIASESEKGNIYISTKRWRGIARIIKAAALFSGRKETNITDTLFLGSRICAKRLSNEALLSGFHKGLEAYLAKHAPNINELETSLQHLHHEAERTVNASGDIYRTVSINNEECVRYTITVAGDTVVLYAPESKIGTTEDFHPFNELRREETRVRCNYMGGSICRISIDSQAKRTGMRASTNTSSGKIFEEFAKLPTEVVHANDPEKMRQNRDNIDKISQQFQSAIAENAQILLNLKALYAEQKQHQQDPFLNKEVYRDFMDSIALRFKKVSENVQALKILQEDFLQRTASKTEAP